MIRVALGTALTVAMGTTPLAAQTPPDPSGAAATTGGATDADPSKSVEALAQRARARYKEGNFSEAVGLYLEAYRIAQASALLYNIALIYDRKLNEPDLAIQFYRRYIGADDADPKVAQRATARVQTLKAAQAAREANKNKPVVGTLPDTTPDPTPGLKGGAKEVPPRVNEDRRLAGWVTVGSGALLLTGGVIFGITAAQTEEDFESADVLSRKESLREDGEGQALLSDVLTVTGVAAVGVGVWLLLTSEEPAEAGEISVGAGPTADGGVGVWLGGPL